MPRSILISALDRLIMDLPDIPTTMDCFPTFPSSYVGLILIGHSYSQSVKPHSSLLREEEDTLPQIIKINIRVYRSKVAIPLFISFLPYDTFLKNPPNIQETLSHIHIM
jgi:hypothetical protein